MAEHDRLAFIGGAKTQDWWLFLNGQEAKISSPPRLWVNNSFAVREAALLGLGVAQLPLMVAQPFFDSGQLVKVLPDWASPTVPVHAVFPSNRYLTPKVRTYIDYAIELF